MVSNKILISICVILLSIGFANAATLNVGQGQTYSTIQSAINAAKTGDVISVNEGTYSENIVVKMNGISIMGQNKEKTIIDGKKTGSVIRIDQANNVKVSGFTVQNSGGSGQSDGGISLYRANNNEIANVILMNNVVGISIYQGSNSNIVSGNDIRSNGKYGVFIFSSNDNRIYNNNIQSNGFGFYGDSARTNHIYSNNFIDNTDQAYDNSGMNSWDDGKSGNYWSPNKDIQGGKAKDNFPLSTPVTIKEEVITTPAEQNTQAGTTPAGTGKSSPGFTGIAVLVSLIVIGILRRKRG
jgi:parallel beta-helix repeat protein